MRYLALVALAVLVVACATAELSPAPRTVSTTRPTGTPATAAPVSPSVPRPPAEASPSPASAAPIGPAYVVDSYGRPQEAGTIIFGSPVEGGLSPYVGWPDAGLQVGDAYAFGAYWGEPTGATRIEISLVRLDGGTEDIVWTDATSIAPDATGFTDTLVPFKRPGLYRLDLTQGDDVLAPSLTQIYPRCVGVCSGG